MVISDARGGAPGLLKALSLLMLAVMLASCARLPMAPIEGDNRPHPGVNRARNLPIQGIDISRYQGDVDFGRLRAAGAHFVFIKATEGADYVDPNFASNWRAARNAGMPRA